MGHPVIEVLHHLVQQPDGRRSSVQSYIINVPSVSRGQVVGLMRRNPGHTSCTGMLEGRGQSVTDALFAVHDSVAHAVSLAWLAC